jgi:general secretion pathway protein I
MRARGLTLVEVLVALAVLGLVAASIVGLIGQNARFIANAEERMLAGVVADNAMVEALGRLAPLERGDGEAETEAAGRLWRVTTRVAETPVEGVVRIDVAVRAGASPQVLARASTLKAEP